MELITSLIRTGVAEALKVSSSVPDELVVTVPTFTPDSSRLPPWVRVPRLPDAENTSWALAPPLRASVRVAPA